MDNAAKLIASYYQDIVPATVGKATIAWNNVSLAVFSLFEILSEMDTDAAKAAFFAVQSDRSQRDMTSALVREKLKPIDKKLAKAAFTALGEIDKIAGRRNDIVHIVFMNDHDPARVRTYNKRGHIKEQEGKELLDSINALTDTSLDWALEIMRIVMQVVNLPQFQNKHLARALLSYNPQQGSGGLANQAGFGLLGLLATNPHSPERAQE